MTTETDRDVSARMKTVRFMDEHGERVLSAIHFAVWVRVNALGVTLSNYGSIEPYTLWIPMHRIVDVKTHTWTLTDGGTVDLNDNTWRVSRREDDGHLSYVRT